jgi:Cu(I)/Ag(I) efflux system periplasmic protein CusF
MKRLMTIAAAGLLALAAQAQAPMTAGEVTKVDKAGSKLTLKHGEIKHLDIPAMTMAFRVADPKLLDGLAPGTRIRFVAERVNGQYTVTQISKAP